MTLSVCVGGCGSGDSAVFCFVFVTSASPLRRYTYFMQKPPPLHNAYTNCDDSLSITAAADCHGVLSSNIEPRKSSYTLVSIPSPKVTVPTERNDPPSGTIYFRVWLKQNLETMPILSAEFLHDAKCVNKRTYIPTYLHSGAYVYKWDVSPLPQ